MEVEDKRVDDPVWQRVLLVEQHPKEDTVGAWDVDLERKQRSKRVEK